MSTLNLTFEELPLWVAQEQAKLLVPSRILKELRGNREVRFKTIDGKLTYFLLDLLKLVGLTELIVNGEVPLIEPPHEQLAVEAPVEKVEPAKPVDLKGLTFVYIDLFTAESNSIPPDQPLPTLRFNKGQKQYECKQELTGYLVDLQYYHAESYGAIFPKVRAILRSTTNPKTYAILQMRLDKFHGSALADTLVRITSEAGKLETPLTITVSRASSGLENYKATMGQHYYQYQKLQDFQAVFSYELIKNNVDITNNQLVKQGLHLAIPALAPSKDRNFTVKKLPNDNF
jgi:hypothetical protein